MKVTLEQQQLGYKYYKDLINKAWEDQNFKEKLIENPTKSLKSFSGDKFNLPENTSIVVEDQTDSSKIYLNIHRKPDFENFELSDEQLEVVAGGIVVGTAGVVLAVVALFGGGIAIGMAMK